MQERPNPAACPRHRILLVDDAADVLATLGTYLERAGFWVHRCEQALEAARLITSPAPIDALVTDYVMPAMTGLDLVRLAQTTRPALPAVVITGYGDSEGLQALPASVLLMRKPFRRETLIQHLRSMLAGARGIPATSPRGAPDAASRT